MSLSPKFLRGKTLVSEIAVGFDFASDWFKKRHVRSDWAMNTFLNYSARESEENAEPT